MACSWPTEHPTHLSRTSRLRLGLGLAGSGSDSDSDRLGLELGLGLGLGTRIIFLLTLLFLPIIRSALASLESRMASSRQKRISEQPYLTVSSVLHTIAISDPTFHRKFPILDLNGSLLFLLKRYTHTVLFAMLRRLELKAIWGRDTFRYRLGSRRVLVRACSLALL